MGDWAAAGGWCWSRCLAGRGVRSRGVGARQLEALGAWREDWRVEAWRGELGIRVSYFQGWKMGLLGLKVYWATFIGFTGKRVWVHMSYTRTRCTRWVNFITQLHTRG